MALNFDTDSIYQVYAAWHRLPSCAVCAAVVQQFACDLLASVFWTGVKNKQGKKTKRNETRMTATVLKQGQNA